MNPFSADALGSSRSCYRNNSSGAMLLTSMFSASHKSICCMSCEATV